MVKLDPTLAGAAQLVYGTYLGSTGEDMLARDLLYTQNPDDTYYRAGGIKVDAAGNAYVTGYAGAATLPYYRHCLPDHLRRNPGRLPDQTQSDRHRPALLDLVRHRRRYPRHGADPR